MAENTNSIERHEDRYSHIGISLQCRIHEKWERLEALGWNEVGFNFYHMCVIPEPVLELKRGLTRLEGTIAWRSLNTNDEVILAALVNEMIFNRAQDMTNNAALHTRLIKLIRVPGMVAEKRKILALLGQDIADTTMADMIARRRLEHPMFHYGVKVASEAWIAIVKKALSISSVVISLEKWSDALSKTQRR